MIPANALYHILKTRGTQRFSGYPGVAEAVSVQRRGSLVHAAEPRLASSVFVFLLLSSAAWRAAGYTNEVEVNFSSLPYIFPQGHWALAWQLEN